MMNPIEFLQKNGLDPDNFRTVPLQVGVNVRDEYYNPKPVERVRVALPGVKAVAAYMQSRGFENVSCRGIEPILPFLIADSFMRKQTKVFISGKISGTDYYITYGKFSNVERYLQQMGYATVNPMKICKKHWSWVRCMAKCLWAIYFCDKVYQLEDWKDSKGARIEYRWAKLLNKRFL